MTDVLVLGAGLVGISSALALQAKGHDVCVLDQRAPGEETSHGNAGVIQAEAREPYAMPRAPSELLHHALRRDNDVHYDFWALPGMARVLWSYFRNSAPSRHAAISKSYAKLIARATQDHGVLIEQSGADALIRRTGLGEVYENEQGFNKRLPQANALRDRYGIEFRPVDGAELKTTEKAVTASPAGAILWADSWSTKDPGALVKAYATLFQKRGGLIEKASVKDLRQAANGWQVDTDNGPFEAGQVVVALGPWSPEILTPLGYRIPMVLKRGYHGHFTSKHTLSRPYFLADHGVVLSSMTRGLRVTTGAHLTTKAAPRDLRQLTKGEAAASRFMDLGEAVPDSNWHGTRPCLPDMLPMVSAAPKHKGLWFNFGHGHQGFTLGPTTGAILAEVMDGRDDELTRALSRRS